MAPTQDMPHHHPTTLFTFSNPTHFIQSKPATCHSFPPSKLFFPLPFPCPFSPESPSTVSAQNDPQLPSKPGQPGSGFPSMVRVGGGLKQSGPGPGPGPGHGPTGGPAFVGQVFSMCDITGTGLMAVSSRIHIPQRAPEWMKKFISSVVKNESGPVFRFFVDLGDAVSYVRRLNIPSGVVGACRLDLAYEHFKEKPHRFQFIPNSKQVKEANKLMKRIKKTGGKSIDGVPVFSAQNLDIAIATPEGIKWYTPYFFDKSILDNILEESVDQHFDALIQNRHVQRRRDVIDDNVAAEIIEESADSIWEPTEVQELMDEMGQSGIPLSVISKAAELQLQYAVDKVLLGNRWLRKATGIQPKFPYMVDSFERRSAASWSRAHKSTSSTPNPDMEVPNKQQFEPDKDEAPFLGQDLRFPRGNWLKVPLRNPDHQPKNEADSRMVNSDRGSNAEEVEMSPLLPRITMVGIATSEPGQMSKATIKKTMEDLSKELEQGSRAPNSGVDFAPERCNHEDRDPLFVANVGDHYSTMGRTTSTRWVRGLHG